MKTRTSFVSNSSSSSFCIMGVLLPFENPEDSFSDWEGLMKFYGSVEGINMSIDYLDGIEELSDCRVFGIRIEAMKDDETKAQFRHRVFELLRKYGYVGKESSVDFRVDGGYC